MNKYLLLIALFTTAANASVQIKWTDNSDNESGFVIERRLSTETKFIKLIKLPVNTVDYTDDASNNKYCYRIGSFNRAGTAYSDEQCIDTLIKPNSPTLRLLLVL